MTYSQVIKIADGVREAGLRKVSYKIISERLNEMGITTIKGKAWNEKTIRSFCMNHGLGENSKKTNLIEEIIACGFGIFSVTKVSENLNKSGSTTPSGLEWNRKRVTMFCFNNGIRVKDHKHKLVEEVRNISDLGGTYNELSERLNKNKIFMYSEKKWTSSSIYNFCKTNKIREIKKYVK